MAHFDVNVMIILLVMDFCAMIILSIMMLIYSTLSHSEARFKQILGLLWSKMKSTESWVRNLQMLAKFVQTRDRINRKNLNPGQDLNEITSSDSLSFLRRLSHQPMTASDFFWRFDEV
jgi:hypothetical protein